MGIYNKCGWVWINRNSSDSIIAENVTYFDCFEVEHIPKEIREVIGNKNNTKNIYIIQ